MKTIAAAEIPVKKEKKKEFIGYIHHFRGLAILFVVACHLLLNWPENSATYKFLDMLWGNGTVLFVFIAGYLFQHLSGNFSYRDYLEKKVKNVIVPYIIVSVPIIVYRIIAKDVPGYITNPHPDFNSWSIAARTGYFMLRGAHLQPLWFVPMIALFYLAAPLFYYIDRHPRWYFLLLVFVAISFAVEREPFSQIGKMFVHFLSVYVFGMFMSRYKTEYLNFAKKYWMLITGLTLAAFVLNGIFYDGYNNPFNYLQKMLLCCFSIYWLWRIGNKVPAFFSDLADLSFGIFFLHYDVLLIIKALYQKISGHGIPGNLLYWSADLLLILAGTIAIIRLVKKIFPSYSRNLIGC